MIKAAESVVEDNIAIFLRERITEEFPGKDGMAKVTVIEGVIPLSDSRNIVDLSNKKQKEFNDELPLVIIRAWEGEEVLESASVKLEIICATYDEGSRGYRSLQSLMATIKRILIENEIVEGEKGFAIKRTTPIRTKVLSEASGGDFWVGRVTLEAYMTYIPQPDFL